MHILFHIIGVENFFQGERRFQESNFVKKIFKVSRHQTGFNLNFQRESVTKRSTLGIRDVVFMEFDIFKISDRIEFIFQIQNPYNSFRMYRLPYRLECIPG